jgi:NAD-dependent DNA ligase
MITNVKEVINNFRCIMQRTIENERIMLSKETYWEICRDFSMVANDLLSIQDNWNEDHITLASIIIEYSDYLYNNTSIDILPLDDGVYDQLLVVYKKYVPDYQTGAKPANFQEMPQNEVSLDQKVMCVTVDKDKMENSLYMKDIWKQHTPINNVRPRNMCFINRPPITKRLINTQHKYPELVGTLDKCKFVLNTDAINKGVFDKPSVQIFERDYIHKCLEAKVISPTEIFDMIGELKYDGVSVEAEVCGDTIISAYSRGDTADNIATDLTPILGGYKFYNASKVPKDLTFGIKFEAIITKRNLERMGAVRGKSYKNCRNAIIGLFGASDAYKFIDYITLIPLSTSLEMDRIDELKFLNHYYNSGEYNRFVVFKGNYQQILFQVKQFTDSAEEIRKILPYMIDGVVISFIDQNKIKLLGRENSINKYQMAIKFNPKKVRTIFLGYTYSIGKSGDIIPMVHFKPCEFIGGIHTKQTIHSYDRFKELNLAIGEQIDIEYVNDVITYVTKPDNEYNRNLNNEPEKFIEKCPYCGGDIVISESGKSAKCVNINCHERKIMRMIDMLSRFGYKDFSEESVRTLDLTEFSDIINCVLNNKVDILGPINSMNFRRYTNALLNNPINDYRLMSAFSFDNMAEEKWKLILKSYSIKDLLQMNDEELYNSLVQIPGIGPKVIESIINGFNLYLNDIIFCIDNCNIINYKNSKTLPKIVITGFRDPAFIDLLINNGFDASDKYSLTKDTKALITSDMNSTSAKMKKAIKYQIPIYTKDKFIKENNIKI